MEFNCAACGVRLRVPDSHRNPRVRCPGCGLVSRPLAERAMPSGVQRRTPPGPQRAAEAPPQDAPRRPEPRPQDRAPARPPRVPHAEPRRTRFPGGVGIGLILLMLLLNRAPQLLRNVLPDKNAPRRAEDRQRELEKLRRGIRETEKRLAGEREQPADNDDPGRRQRLREDQHQD